MFPTAESALQFKSRPWMFHLPRRIHLGLRQLPTEIFGVVRVDGQVHTNPSNNSAATHDLAIAIRTANAVWCVGPVGRVVPIHYSSPHIIKSCQPWQAVEEILAKPRQSHVLDIAASFLSCIAPFHN